MWQTKVKFSVGLLIKDFFFKVKYIKQAKLYKTEKRL